MSPTLLFFCMLLLPRLGTSTNHVSYTLGSRQFFVRSSAHSQAPSSASATCSSVPSEVRDDRLLAVHHRLSPCSPQNREIPCRRCTAGAGKQSDPLPTTDAVFRRDLRRIRSLFAGRRSAGLAGNVPAPAPAPAADGVTIPVHGTTVPKEPGVQDYTVLVGYGTPAQVFPMAFDTVLGISLVRCKPCASGASDCDPAFDASASSTFTPIPCGSPECRSNCSGSSSVCPLPLSELEGAVVQDVLTLVPSVAGVVRDFTFGCLLDLESSQSQAVAGVLDLSLDSRSVASRLATPGAPALSYCLPLSTSSPRGGFLSIGAARPEYTNGGGRVRHAPLVLNPASPSVYFVELVGISLGGRDIPIPPEANTANTTVIDATVAFTFLRPSVYAPLRDAFRESMSEYPTAPAFRGLDTCYNFTGLDMYRIQLVELKFGNGESLVLGTEQMLYYEDPSAGFFSVACLAFAAYPLEDGGGYSVIGTLAQTSTEVVYDVAGGKVGFIPDSC